MPQSRSDTGMRINGMSKKLPTDAVRYRSISPKESVAEFVQSIKIQSTRWINENHMSNGKRFSWQRGYGVFSYSRSQINQVVRYIDNQEQHHRLESMTEEYKRILRNLGIEFDDRYVFDDVQPLRG